MLGTDECKVSSHDWDPINHAHYVTHSKVLFEVRLGPLVVAMLEQAHSVVESRVVGNVGEEHIVGNLL